MNRPFMFQCKACLRKYDFECQEGTKCGNDIPGGGYCPGTSYYDLRQPAGGLPTEAKARKALPVCTGVLDYFPDALAAVAEVSRIGNEQHNPGQPLHWAKEKSADHEDALIRHLMDRGKIDTDGSRHSAKVAWRALAMLQTEIEKNRK